MVLHGPRTPACRHAGILARVLFVDGVVDTVFLELTLQLQKVEIEAKCSDLLKAKDAEIAALQV